MLFCLCWMQTLARLLREEMKRSIDLCINIVSVFFSVSNFSQFHQIIMDNQVRTVLLRGRPCMPMSHLTQYAGGGIH